MEGTNAIPPVPGLHCNLLLQLPIANVVRGGVLQCVLVHGAIIQHEAVLGQPIRGFCGVCVAAASSTGEAGQQQAMDDNLTHTVSVGSVREARLLGMEVRCQSNQLYQYHTHA